MPAESSEYYQVPAYCPDDRIFFDSGIAMSVGTTGRLSRNLSGCPICERPRPVIEGLMMVVDEGGTAQVQIIEGPQWSKDAVAFLRHNLQQVVEDEPDDVPAAVEKFAPKIGERLRRLAGRGWTKRQLLGAVGSVLGILQFFGVGADEVSDAARWTVEQGWEQIENLLDELEEADPPATEPEERNPPAPPAPE